MTKNNSEITKRTILILIGVVIGIFIMMLVSSNIDAETKKVNPLGGNNSITNIIDHEAIGEQSDIDSVKAEIKEYTDDIRNNASYVQLRIGNNQYMFYMYNSKGEMVMQNDTSGVTEVVLDSGKALKYQAATSALVEGYDIDIATLIDNAFGACGSSNVRLYKMKDNEELQLGDDIIEYRVILEGDEAVKRLYSNLSNEFAQDMLDGLKQAVYENTELGAIDNDESVDVSEVEQNLTDEQLEIAKAWDPKVILVLRLNTKNIEETYGYLMYVKDGEEYTNWVLQGHAHTEDWTLPEDWYTYTTDGDENGEKFTSIMIDTMNTINLVMDHYAEEQGWNLEETDTTEDTNNDSKEVMNTTSTGSAITDSESE